MPLDTALEDDYIISLLQKDAKANENQTFVTGAGSTLSRKPGNAPKPNTRFLKNIIRDTNSHNATLKAKEEAESKARLRDLRREENARKRGLVSGENGESSSSKRMHDRPGRWASALGIGGSSESRSDRRKDRNGKDSRRRSRSPERKHRKRSDKDRRRDRSRNRSRNRTSSRSRSPERRKNHDRHDERKDRSRSPDRRHRYERRRSRSPPEKTRHPSPNASDTDRMDEDIGPKPAPASKPRGRGANQPSNIDSRFREDYDPRTDVSVEPTEDDDWDMALEAMRDRTKHRKQGADRLRAAGFTEAEVGKWEKGGEKDVDDVKWRKRGEEKEWDRGKVLDNDGDVELKATWAK